MSPAFSTATAEKIMKVISHLVHLFIHATINGGHNYLLKLLNALIDIDFTNFLLLLLTHRLKEIVAS